MKNKFFFTVLIIILLSIGLGVWLIFFKNSDVKELNLLKKEQPELAEYVDKIFLWKEKVKQDPSRVESYLTLGMAWKSLADRTNNPKHYKSALAVYESGIDLTERKNALFIGNAASMATHIGDFVLAERYLQEAIVVNPGDWELYQKLAELYEYNLKKEKKEILAIFDKAELRIINKKIIEQLRKEYLERNK